MWVKRKREREMMMMKKITERVVCNLSGFHCNMCSFFCLPHFFESFLQFKRSVTQNLKIVGH